jgi:hypothetical protein
MQPDRLRRRRHVSLNSTHPCSLQLEVKGVTAELHQQTTGRLQALGKQIRCCNNVVDVVVQNRPYSSKTCRSETFNRCPLC